MLDAEIFEIDKITANGQTGFRFGLVHPQDVPFMRDNLAYISPGCGIKFLHGLHGLKELFKQFLL